MSPDPFIRLLAERRDALRREAEKAVSVLTVYAAMYAVSGVWSSMVPVPPLRHSAMTDSEACGCGVCAEWRIRGDELAAALRCVPKGHRWSVCACADCRFVGRMHLNYVAAANVRDLMIGVAYHAGSQSAYGEKVMEWFEVEIRQPRYTVDWCAYELGRRPVDEWLSKCEAALSPVLSGAVFVAADVSREAFPVWQSSQLGDVDAFAPMEAA